jgi:hypothetical protein
MEPWRDCIVMVSERKTANYLMPGMAFNICRAEVLASSTSVEASIVLVNGRALAHWMHL